MELTKRKCVPCEGGVPKLTSSEIEQFNSMLKQAWKVIDDIKIQNEFLFDSYPESIRFVNSIAEIAEDEGHHPVIHVFYKKVVVDIWTFAILGLSENDFILAAKIDDIS